MTLARMWLEQAENFRLRARAELGAGLWAGACFNCQQAVESALKAVLRLRQADYPRTHSVQQLLTECARYNSEFDRFAGRANFTDQIYLGARYVDGSDTPVVPSQRYSEADAEAASTYANGIMALAQAQFVTEDQDTKT